MNAIEEPNVYLDEYLDLQKYWLVIKRRWLPATATTLGVITLALAYGFSLEKQYEAEAKLLIKTDSTANLTGIANETGDIEVISENSDPLATEAEILRSRPIINKSIEAIDLRDDEGELIKYRSFIESLKVRSITGTDILEITYRNSDPELAALVVNQVLEIYKSQDTLSNRTEAAAAKKFITEQLPQVEANVKGADAKLREFQNKYQIANLSEETTASINNLNAQKNQINELEAELKNIDARYDRLSSQLGMNWQEASAIAALSQSLAVQTTFQRLQEVKVELAQKQNYLSNKTPQIISLQEEIADLEQLLDREIAKTLGREKAGTLNNLSVLALGQEQQGQIVAFADLGLERAGLRQKLATIKSTYEANQTRSNLLPQLEEEHKELQRQIEAAQSTYSILLNKLQEIKIAEEQDIGKVRIISRAVVPELAVGPNKKIILAAGGILGLFLGIIVAFLLDLKDNTVKNLKEAEAMLPYTLQGVIPKVKRIPNASEDREQKNILFSQNDNLVSISLREAYQNIQINLRFLDAYERLRIIAITSAVPREGKSSVAANYATTQAQSGKRILLIDGDLRRPTQHKIWRLPDLIGLSNVLTHEVAWYDVVQNVMPNLDILTAGTETENPVSLLDSLLLNALVGKMLNTYDLIIFDTPPLVGLADTKIIGKIADGLLLVVRPGVASYGSVNAAKKILKTAELDVLGIVANGVDPSQESSGYEYHCSEPKYIEAAP